MGRFLGRPNEKWDTLLLPPPRLGCHTSSPTCKTGWKRLSYASRRRRTRVRGPSCSWPGDTAHILGLGVHEQSFRRPVTIELDFRAARSLSASQGRGSHQLTLQGLPITPVPLKTPGETTPPVLWPRGFLACGQFFHQTVRALRRIRIPPAI